MMKIFVKKTVKERVKRMTVKQKVWLALNPINGREEISDLFSNL